ncbi:MAG: hypothetical protein R6V85_07100, partial [Polyangia bacterium]
SIAAISATDCHTSALKSSGNVRTWGCAYQPQQSLSEVTPDNRLIDFGGAAVQISTGEDHHCVLVEGGDVYCCGFNEQGQLGYGHTDFVAAGQVPDEVGPVELGEPAVQVAAGGDHTCAILEAGDVVCWGWNGAGGQLGYGNTENVGDNELPADVGTVDLGGQAASISAGMQHTCAILVFESGYRDRAPPTGPPARNAFPTARSARTGSRLTSSLARVIHNRPARKWRNW